MEKPKIDIDGDGEGDLGKGAIKIILGLIFDRERTLNSLENTFNNLMKWVVIIFLIVAVFWLFIMFTDWRIENAYIREYATIEVLEKEDGKATIQLTETVENRNLAIGWISVLVYDKKEDEFIESRIMTAEQLNDMNWQFILQKKNILYLGLYSKYHEPLQDFKIDYGIRMKIDDGIVARHYESDAPGHTYPRLEIPGVMSEDGGSYLIEEKEVIDSFKMRDWTPRDWSKYNTITENGELVLANMTLGFCELEKNDEGNDISVIKKVLSFASPYQTSPYHEQKYGWTTPLEIAKGMKCKELVEMYDEWW